MTIWLYYIPRQPKLFEVGGVHYFVSVKNDTPLLEVPKDKQDEFLRLKCGCCGNERPCFRVATEAEVARHFQTP